MQVACAQHIEDKLIGSWITNTSYEHPDVVIFRSDGKYFIYNSNSVDVGSLGLTRNLPSDDIIINGAYTTMTERGTWEYNESSGNLFLKNRNILEEYADFSNFYGKSDELVFALKNSTETVFEVCFERESKQICEKYVKNWSHSTGEDEKFFYKEIKQAFSGKVDQVEQFILSGYETELKITYDLDFSDTLSVTDGEVELSNITSTQNGKIEVMLKGVTNLVLMVNRKRQSTDWSFEIEIK